jgi:hypothetical protein
MKQRRAGDACDSAISLTARGHASMLVLALDERVVAAALRAL